MKPIFSLTFCLLLAACEGYKTPGVGQSPQEMSADTLCYRYAYARRDEALEREAAARNLDCADILRDQPQSHSPSHDPMRL